MTAANAVNPEARRAFAQLLRQFHSGLVTNFEYEDRVDSIRRTLGTDDAVDDIHFTQWHAYCDVFEHRMTDAGHRLNQQQRRWVARCVLFLRSHPAQRHKAVSPLSARETLWLLAVAVLSLVPCAAVLAGLATSNRVFVVGGITVFVVSWIAAWAHHGVRFGRTERTTADTSSQLANEEFWPFATESVFCESLFRPTYLSGHALVATIGRL